MVLLLLACDTASPDAPAESVFVPLDRRRLARRLSIDLRGELPSASELAVAKEPGGIEALTERWLADPSFEDHLAELVAEEWLMRLDTLRIDTAEFHLEPDEGYAFTRAFGDEPARLFAHIAAGISPSPGSSPPT